MNKKSLNPTVALFGGGFKPPTKGHLSVVLKGLKENLDINKVIITIGKKPRGGITQSKAVKIWEIYKRLIPVESEIVTTESPFLFYKEYLKEHKEDKVYVFIGARHNNKKDRIDVLERSQFVKKYSKNVIPKEVLTEEGISGTKARSFLSKNLKDFKQTLPNALTEREKNQIYGYIKEETDKKFLYAFDLDDTLITSKSNVIVTNPEQGTFKLTPAEYAVYEPGPNDELDFSEFGRLINPKTIKDNFNKFSQILKRTSDLPNTHTIILTARQPEVSADLEAFLEKRNLPQVKLHAVGNSSPESKKEVIQDYINQGFNKIRFYDDSSKNIEVMKTLNSPETEVITKLVVSEPLNEDKKDPFGLIQFVNEVMEVENFDYTPYIDSFTDYMVSNGINIEPLPKVTFIEDDVDNAQDIFGKTAVYDPNQHEVILYTMGRHPKDILRSFAHELIHHHQNLEDRLGNITGTDTREDDHLTNLEREAYTDGNLNFRKWTETLTEGQISELSLSNPKQVKFWALFAHIFSTLKKDPSSFEDLKNTLEGESLEALYYFWDLLESGELVEHFKKCNCV